MIRFVIAAAIAIAATFPTPAQAGPVAYLVRCDIGTSPYSGAAVYTGTYRYNGQVFVFQFPNYCPATVELY